MGTYCDLYIGKYSIHSTKNAPDYQLLTTLFRQIDLVRKKRKVGERIDGKYFNNPNVIENSFYFQISVKELSQRLDILGFTLTRARQQFYKAKKQWLAEERSKLKTYDQSDDEDIIKHMIALHKSTIGYFETLSFERFAEEYKKFIAKKRYPYISTGLVYKVVSLEDYLRSEEKGLLELDYFNPFLVFRIILATQPQKRMVTYELTDLLNGGYITKRLVNWEETDKIILLTEGSTDSHFLKESLSILYPHLTPIFYFMNFHDARSPGGAGHLVNIVKAFIGSGIRNKIVALFDNDTGAKEAILQLKGIKIPANIKILQYPPLKFAEKYPTQGPTGLTYLDINGLACSIELYLGKDVIINKRRYPVHWKGFSTKTKQYQGEILNKEVIQDAFKQKVRRAKDERKTGDWTGVDLILQHIFQAFQ